MDASDEREIQAAIQQVVDVAAAAHTRDADTDVEGELRRGMSSAALEVHEEWLRETAHAIRSGHHVTVADPEQPGSLGGDNGGG